MTYNLYLSDGSCIPCPPECTLLEALQSAGLRQPESPCGGRGQCGKCLAEVRGPLVGIETGNLLTAAGEKLLLCRWRPRGDCRITLESPRAMRILTAGAESIPPDGSGLGLAVDIGTTTLAAYLYDLSTGSCLCSAGEPNAQSPFGADVISRLSACGQGKLPELRRLVTDQIAALAEALCRQSGCRRRDIRRLSLVGNTVMEHIFCGIDPTPIGKAPFTPPDLFGRVLPLTPWPGFDGEVYLAPAAAAYVGGDVTAGMLAAGLSQNEELTLYIDIGTNGEMALGDKNGYLCCAAAAGPAFEGALIRCGMAAADGAIDRVDKEKLSVRVIGNGKAVGLCGSGLLDAVAGMLVRGIVDETGRLLPGSEVPEPFRSRIREEGEHRFMLTEQVYVTAGDVRQLQLAKAAIRAGAETLLEQSGKSARDIQSLIVAGGFGTHMNIQSALAIGLLPDTDPERIRFVGNAAGAGAAMALTESGKQALEALAARCEYIELSGSPCFMEHYVDCMGFGDDN